MSEDINNKNKCADEIDRTAIEQIYESTLQISNQCFEYKKLCVTVLGVIVAALLKLGDPTSFCVISIIGLGVGVGFWLCDSIAYFYQKKNRSVMDRITRKIQDRNLVDNVDDPAEPVPWPKAFFNPSMTLYMYISVICITVLCYDNWSTIITYFVK